MTTRGPWLGAVAALLSIAVSCAPPAPRPVQSPPAAPPAHDEALAGPRLSATYPYRVAILSDAKRRELAAQLEAEVPGWKVKVDELGYIRSLQYTLLLGERATSTTARLTAVVAKLHARLGLREGRPVRAAETIHAWFVQDETGWVNGGLSFGLANGSLEMFEGPHHHPWEVLAPRTFAGQCRDAPSACPLVEQLLASRIGENATFYPVDIPGHPGPPGGVGIAPVRSPPRPDTLRREDIALWPAIAILENTGAAEAEIRLAERVDLLPRSGGGIAVDPPLPRAIDAVTHASLDGQLKFSWSRPEPEILVFHDGVQDLPGRQ